MKLVEVASTTNDFCCCGCDCDCCIVRYSLAGVGGLVSPSSILQYCGFNGVDGAQLKAVPSVDVSFCNVLPSPSVDVLYEY